MYKMLVPLATVLIMLMIDVAECRTEEDIESLKNSIVDMKRELAWYSLHVAAAAACRGSTETGGSGNHGNAVRPKENTKSCDDQCGETAYSVCDADVAINGSFGKATTYELNVGQFYNYGCDRVGNSREDFDEVKADEDGVFNLTVNPATLWTSYYRFCCCRYP